MRTHMTLARTIAVAMTTLVAGACRDATSPAVPVAPTAPSLAKGTKTPPTSGRIYFTSNFAGSVDVYSMKPDGSDRRRLTLTTADDESWVNVSPDGQKLVVGSQRRDFSGGELVTMNVDGTNRRVLVTTTNPYVKWEPVFSADGRTIAYVTNEAGDAMTSSIWTVPANGGKVTRLTSPSQAAYGPSYSPDGTRIVYTVWQAADNANLYTMNADGSNSQLLHDCVDACADPLWSPDGSRILSWVNNWSLASNQLEYCILLNAIPQCGVELDIDGVSSEAAFSPDGSQVVFASHTQINGVNVQRISTINVNGSGETVLTPDLGAIFSLAWGR